jgi:DDE superfamily endonuclease
VIVDEFGCNLDLTRRYARAPIGKRAASSIPRNTPPNQTIIASLHPGGMGPSMQLSGGTDSAAFASYIEQILGPTLRPGQIVLVDNLSAHSAPHIAELVAARGCRLWFLPAVLAGLVANRTGDRKSQEHVARHRRADDGGALSSGRHGTKPDF